MNTSQPPMYYDPEAHEPGCSRVSFDTGCCDPGRYFDVFCDCHHYTEPKVLTNGTDIAWPAGWEQGQASQWRRAHNLQPPTER
jgi:hypothetical protein